MTKPAALIFQTSIICLPPCSALSPIGLLWFWWKSLSLLIKLFCCYLFIYIHKILVTFTTYLFYATRVSTTVRLKSPTCNNQAAAPSPSWNNQKTTAHYKCYIHLKNQTQRYSLTHTHNHSTIHPTQVLPEETASSLLSKLSLSFFLPSPPPLTSLQTDTHQYARGATAGFRHIGGGPSDLSIDPNGKRVAGSTPGHPQGCPGGRGDMEEPLEVTTPSAWQ